MRAKRTPAADIKAMVVELLDSEEFKNVPYQLPDLGASVVPVLMEILDETEREDVLVRAIQALSRLSNSPGKDAADNTQVTQAIRRRAERATPQVRQAAARAIADLAADSDTDQEYLFSLLRNGTTGERKRAAQALGVLGGPMAQAALLRALADPYWAVQAAAAAALAGFGLPHQALPQLRRLADGTSDPTVRGATRQAIHQLETASRATASDRHTGATPMRELSGLAKEQRARLVEYGLETVEEFLVAAATQAQRRKLAAATGVPETTLTALVEQADLMQIRGVGPKRVDLLHQGGIRRTQDLAVYPPNILHSRLQRMRAAGMSVPGLAEIERWVHQARSLAGKICDT